MTTQSRWRWNLFITRPIMLHNQYFRLCASLHLGWRTPLNITSVSTRSTPTPAMGSQKYTVTNRSMQRRCCSTIFIKISDKHSLEGSGRRWCPRHQSNYNIQGKGGRNSKDCLLPSLRPLTVQCLLWKRWSSDCPLGLGEIGLKDPNFKICQKCPSLRPKKWHFWWHNQNSKTTFII